MSTDLVLCDFLDGLWRGDIVFWETLSVNSVKMPRKYNRNHADLFCRLRVPLYLKVFETLFFAVFLALYYAVLVHRDFHRVTISEILLYIWIASFAYDEFADWVDAGQTSFYASDFWWTWDISIVLVGMIFCVLRVVGLSSGSRDTVDLAYDVLGLEALFLVPRIFSLLSLNRYFGTLVSHRFHLSCLLATWRWRIFKDYDAMCLLFLPHHDRRAWKS
jgi:hypothetical protein